MLFGGPRPEGGLELSLKAQVGLDLGTLGEGGTDLREKSQDKKLGWKK